MVTRVSGFRPSLSTLPSAIAHALRRRLSRLPALFWLAYAVQLVFILFTMRYDFANPLAAARILLLLHYVLVIALALLPLPCAVGLFALHTVTFAVPGVYPAAQYMGVTLAMGVMGYLLPARRALPACAGLSVLWLAEHYARFGWEAVLNPFVGYTGQMMLACCIGLTLRLSERKAAAAQADKDAAMMRLTAEMSRRIHDDMTNDLSFMAAIARKHLDHAGSHSAPNANESDRNDWQTLFDRSQVAFSHVYRLIDSIPAFDSSVSDASPSATAESTPDLTTALTHRLATSEAELAALGIHGETRVIGHATPSPAVTTEVLGFVGELCTNLRKYCAEGDDVYSLIIRLSASSIDITQTNDIRRPGPLSLHTHGAGIRAYARSWERLGGTIHCHDDGESWIIHAAIAL